MKKPDVKALTKTALLTAFLAVVSQISLPIGPIPVSLGVFGVYIIGMLLTPGHAVSSILVYILLGLAGVPVFAGFQAGPAVLFGKTGGYILGYLFIALFVSVAVHRKCKKIIIFISMVAGLLACYALGSAYFMIITKLSLWAALGYCVFPFIIPDICKGVAAYLLSITIKKRMGSRIA